MTNVIWIDQNADNEENTEYFKLLKSMDSLKVRLFKNTNAAIHYLKKKNSKKLKSLLVVDYMMNLLSISKKIQRLCMLFQKLLYLQVMPRKLS